MNAVAQVPGQQGELHTPSLAQPSGAQLTPIAGTVTHQIGTGDNAQNAIVYRTILWSFVAGGIFSLAAFGHAVLKSSPSPLSEIKDVWAIFAPLITLALGYLFGKGK
jgi:hypothetical protein